MLIGREQQLLFLLLLGHMTQIWYIPIAQLYTSYVWIKLLYMLTTMSKDASIR
jgi:hypothetical protein